MEFSADFEEVRKAILTLTLGSFSIPEHLLKEGLDSNYASAGLAGKHYAQLIGQGLFGTVQVINCELLTERRQFRFPRSKKRRIREKWAKDFRNYRQEPSPHAVREGYQYFVHPRMRKRLVRKIKMALAEAGITRD